MQKIEKNIFGRERNWEFGNIPGNALVETGGNRELDPKKIGNGRESGT